MKLLVCISQTPDTTANISFKDNNTVFNSEGVQFIMNPYDEWYALVRALELKEAVGTGSVTILNVGPSTNDAVIRKGLAVGADDAVRIDTEALSANYVAKQIAEYAKGKEYDIIFFGKETIDFNGAIVPSMVAEYMDLPFVSLVHNMEVSGNTATLKRDVEGGVEVISVDLPLVLSASKGLAEQRIPNMKGIMMSRRKPLVVVPAADVANPVEVASYEMPPAKSAVKLIDPENMDELVNLLHNEAKVI